MFWLGFLLGFLVGGMCAFTLMCLLVGGTKNE